jgi:hypothetical protein
VCEDYSVGIAEYFSANLLTLLRDHPLCRTIAQHPKSRKKMFEAIFKFTTRNWWPLTHIPKDSQRITDEHIAECISILLKSPNIFDFNPIELQHIKDFGKIHEILRLSRQIRDLTNKDQALQFIGISLSLHETVTRKTVHERLVTKVEFDRCLVFVLWAAKRWPVFSPTFHSGLKGAAIAPTLWQASPHPKVPPTLPDVRVVDMANPDCSFHDPGLRTFGQSGMDPRSMHTAHLLGQVVRTLLAIDTVISGEHLNEHYWSRFTFI